MNKIQKAVYKEKTVKKNSVLIFATLIAMALGFQAISAQITINLPKIPKIKKDKPTPKDQPATDSNNQTNSNQTNANQTTQPQTTTTKDDEQVDGRLLLFLDQITKAEKEVDEYTPQTHSYLVSGSSKEWLWNAVSPKMRNQFIEKWKVIMSAATQKKFEDALNQLSASAAVKLPTYIPGNNNFAFHNLAEEKMMKGTLEDPSTIKIHKIGLFHSTWQISKNDYGLPEARYKQGYMWVRNTIDSHPYCRLFQINIIQDYAGGGTYGQSYARFIDDNLFGCPSGSK